jgi:hypothetical protein
MHTIVIDSSMFSTFKGFLEHMSGMLLDGSYETSLNGLDAFADALEGGFGVYSESDHIKVKWVGVNKSKNELGVEETLNYFNDILKDCHPTARDEVREQIMFVQTDERYNLFYFIMDILLEAKNIKSIELQSTQRE